MDINTASTQWANRPNDERHWTLAELIAAAEGYKMAAEESVVAPHDLEVCATADDRGLMLRKRGSNSFGYFSHFAFAQTCKLAGNDDVEGSRPSAGYLRTLPAHLAAECLTVGLRQRENKDLSVLWDRRKVGDGIKMRAVTSTRYGRIWNADLAKRVEPLQAEGWRNPPARPARDDPRARPATAADLLESRNRTGGAAGIQLGDMIAPAGLYLSEKDMFLFLVNESYPINNGGSPLYRGFFMENSEVGDRSFKLTTFLYNMVCGNHIVWGASNVEELKIVHLGDANARSIEKMRLELRRYCESSANEIEGKIAKARTIILGKTKDEVLDALLFGYKLKGAVPQKVLSASFDAARSHPEDGGNAPAESVWGMVQGMTRVSQNAAYADERVKLDRAASTVLEAVPF